MPPATRAPRGMLMCARSGSIFPRGPWRICLTPVAPTACVPPAARAPTPRDVDNLPARADYHADPHRAVGDIAAPTPAEPDPVRHMRL